ncbi:hypothetical protein HanIR_Chr04g0164651 [Helianthus annuus]|nr:hypothetical protein HanIR_Chr04g0164651 [Helianthus annuus]
MYCGRSEIFTSWVVNKSLAISQSLTTKTLRMPSRIMNMCPYRSAKDAKVTWGRSGPLKTLKWPIIGHAPLASGGLEVAL